MDRIKEKGFTMIEILVVIAILGVLAGTIIPLVAHYIDTGKNDYNEKLKNQLLISGKEYYADNKNLLPGRASGNNYSFVTLPEMQSKNYLSKEFVDADKRNCRLSYVFVEETETKDDDYNWVPCLICGEGDDKQVYGDETACQVSSWNDEKQPVCSVEGAKFTGGGKNAAGIYVNPSTVTLEGLSNVDNGKSGRIVVTKDESKTVEIKVSDVSTLINTPQRISKLVPEAIKCEKEICKYEVKVRAGSIKSKEICAEFLIDTTVPRCELEKVGNKYKPDNVKLSLLEGAGNYSGQILVRKDNAEIEGSAKEYPNLTDGINYTANSSLYADGNYEVFIKYNNGSEMSCGEFSVDKTPPKCEFDYNGYTNTLTLNSEKTASYKISTGSTLLHKDKFTNTSSFVVPSISDLKEYKAEVIDLAGNKAPCSKITNKAENPTCSFPPSITSWLNDSKVGVNQTLKAQCKYKSAYPVTIDTSKIVDTNNYVSNPTATHTSTTSGYYTTTTFTINFSAIDGKGGTTGKEYIKLNEGLVKLTEDTNFKNSSASSTLNVDTVAPTISYAPQTSKHADGWYYATFKVKMQCSDTGGSGVNTFKINNTTYANPSTISRTTAANPVTYGTSCTDKAGNTGTNSASYKVKVNSAVSSCGCSVYNQVRDYCKTYNSCSACGCKTYRYYFGSGAWQTKNQASKPSAGISSCNSSNVGSYKRTSISCVSCLRTNYKPPCTTPRNNRCAKWKYFTQKCYKECSAYKSCSSCSCATWAYKNGTCKTYKTCWHY